MDDVPFRIWVEDGIPRVGLNRFPAERYSRAQHFGDADAILVRAATLDDEALTPSLKAVAGVGGDMNNIPMDSLGKRGIPVFSAPGAKANAVKELVIAALLIAARNIVPAWQYVQALTGSVEEWDQSIKSDKERFVGRELAGRSLGVVGLGAVGVKVANAALSLGMRVSGADPELTVARAWELDAAVESAAGLEALLARSEFVSLHVPLTPATRNLINGERLSLIRPGAVLLNLARNEVVDEKAILNALEEKRLAAYVTDFPSPVLREHRAVVSLPHLGGSTGEAEEQATISAADTLRSFLETGNITHSLNFPDTVMPQPFKATRIAIANANVPNVVGQITLAVAGFSLNIHDMLNRSRGELAYTLIDVEGLIPQDVMVALAKIPGVLSVRILRPPVLISH